MKRAWKEVILPLGAMVLIPVGFLAGIVVAAFLTMWFWTAVHAIWIAVIH